MLTMMPLPPIPPIPHPVAFTPGMFWGLIAFVLVLFLAVVLWVISVVRSQKQAQIKEVRREYEEFPRTTEHEQPVVELPKEEVLTKR